MEKDYEVCQSCGGSGNPSEDVIGLYHECTSCKGSGRNNKKLNVHIIVGPNGMCRCGEDNKLCSEFLKEKENEEVYWFKEIMAIFHGDGGHYLDKHGVEKSAKDALTKYYELKTKEARPVPEEAAEKQALQTHNTASTKLPGFEEIWNKFTEHWYKERVCTPLPVARQSAEFVYEFIARQLRASC